MKRRGFSLTEILIAIIIIGILAVLFINFYKMHIEKAKSAEGISNAGIIRKAEEIHRLDKNNYIAANNTEEVNERLGLEIKSKYYGYQVVNVTDDNFIIIAKRIGEDISLPSDIKFIVMDKIGLIRSGYENYLGEGSGGGGGGGVAGTGGSGGGGGGGTAGGGSGGGGTGIGGIGGGETGGGGGTTGGGGTGGGGTGGGGTGETVTTSKPVYTSEIEAALELLKNSATGVYYYNLIMEKMIPVVYEAGPSNAMAWWKGISYNTIYVNQILKNSAPESAIAALIAHEATHADYDYYPQKWIDRTLELHSELTTDDLHITVLPGDSIDQEYNSFSSQVNTWKEVKGEDTDYNNDAWTAIYDQGESYMKAQIRLAYTGQGLPEY